jgi:hypothetical protein
MARAVARADQPKVREKGSGPRKKADYPDPIDFGEVLGP